MAFHVVVRNDWIAVPTVVTTVFIPFQTFVKSVDIADRTAVNMVWILCQQEDKKDASPSKTVLPSCAISSHRLIRKSFIALHAAMAADLIASHMAITPSLNQSHLFQSRIIPAITAVIAIGTRPMADTTAVIPGITVPVTNPITLDTIPVILETTEITLPIAPTTTPIALITFPIVIKTGLVTATTAVIVAIIILVLSSNPINQSKNS